MKKTTYLIIISFLIMNYSKAQKISFGITAGVALAFDKTKYKSESFTSNAKVGFTAGVISSIAVGKHFSFQPALNFIQKGGKYNEFLGTYASKTTLNYLELPLNFVYNTNAAKGKIFAGAGPCFSLGLSGKEKWHDGNESGTDDIKFGSNDDDDFKPLEVGINFLAGYQLKNGLFIAANYNAGFNNIINEDPEYPLDTKYHNRYFGVRIGCMLGGKKK